jgi:transposase-like protein
MLHVMICITAAVNLEASRGILGMTEFDERDESVWRWIRRFERHETTAME